MMGTVARISGFEPEWWIYGSIGFMNSKHSTSPSANFQ